MKAAVSLTAALVLLTEITASPLSTRHESKLFGMLGGGDLFNKDQDVKELERLKPISSFSVMKSHSDLYSNVDGKERQLARTEERVDKDGSLLAKMERTIDKGGEEAEPRVVTSLDVPSRNIHQVLGNRPSSQMEPEARVWQDGVPVRASDMAAYIFWTGDERGVTSIVEQYLQQGLMSKGDAIDLLQEIKRNLELMQNQYAEPSLSSVKDEYEKKNFMLKKSLQDSQGLSSVGSLIAGSQLVGNGMPPQDDYEDLVERLRATENTVDEFSLEEVIYQLAKVMFTESLSRGSVEAQDALQKVTGFLDASAQQGKITRHVEKTLLAVLISALSDTLTQHPELVSTARQSLGILQPEPLLHQFNAPGLLNKGEKDEPVERTKDAQKPETAKPVLKKKRTIQDSGLKDDVAPKH